MDVRYYLLDLSLLRPKNRWVACHILSRARQGNAENTHAEARDDSESGTTEN